MMKQVMARLKNPFFLMALAGLGYQAFEALGVIIPRGTYEQAIDCITYLFIGTGVYASFDAKEGGEK